MVLFKESSSTQLAEKFPQFKPFLYRAPDACNYTAELTNMQKKLIEAFCGIKMVQYKSLLSFVFHPDGSEWNWLKYQSRGTVIDLRNPGGCVMFGLQHYDYLNLNTQCSWPIEQDSDAKVISSFPGKVVYVLKYTGTVLFCSPEGFELPEVAIATQLAPQYSLDALDFDNYWHVLGINADETSLCLLAVREKTSHDLVTTASTKAEILTHEGNASKLSVWRANEN